LRRDGRTPDEMDFPRIVSDELSDAAHDPAICATGIRPAKLRYLLRGGLVRCAEHGLTMGGSSSGDGTIGRYRCTRQLGGCTKRAIHSVAAQALEQAVWDEARERLDAKVAQIEADLEQTRREIRQAEARAQARVVRAA
jgi:hypothetical protein